MSIINVSEATKNDNQIEEIAHVILFFVESFITIPITPGIINNIPKVIIQESPKLYRRDK